MTRTTDSETLGLPAEALSAMAACLGPEAAAVCGPPAAGLAAAMTAPAPQMNATLLPHLAKGLAALAPRLGPGDATEAASTLTHAMTRATAAYRLPPGPGPGGSHARNAKP